MAIKIIDEKPDVYITTEEYNRYMQEYQQFTMLHSLPPTFEDFVRAKKRGEVVPTMTGTFQDELYKVTC